VTRATRYLLALLGLVNAGLGILGVFVPGLPTTIFLILASWCFTRSCPWLEERLFRLRLLRPYVKLAKGEESLSPRARIASAALMWTAIAVSLLVLRAGDILTPWLAAILILAGIVGTVVIARFRRSKWSMRKVETSTMPSPRATGPAARARAPAARRTRRCPESGARGRT